MSLELRFSLPGQPVQSVLVEDRRMLIGSLPSNEIIINAPGIDPIHAMIEKNEQGNLVVIDLGSENGIKLNNRLVEVESNIAIGDVIEVANIRIAVEKYSAMPVIPMAPTQIASGDGMQTTQSPPKSIPVSARQLSAAQTGHQEESEKATSRESQAQLFSPKSAKPRGDVLEVVAYWGSTILEVELFGKGQKNFEYCKIGDSSKSHLPAGGQNAVKNHVFAVPSSSGFKVNLLEGMKARVRSGTSVKEKLGPASISLSMKDIVHVTFDAVQYFVLYVKPPEVDLPPNRAKDPFFAALLSLALIFYFIVSPLIWMADPIPSDSNSDDTWAMVNLPEKEKEIVKEKVPQPKKPPQEVKKVEVKPPPTPPKPPEKQPAPVVAVQKPVQTKPTPTPAKENKENVAVKNQLNNAEKTKTDLTKLSSSNDNSKGGMAKSAALTPDFKLAGAPSKNPSKATGGAAGSGMNQAGAPIKGNKDQSVKGVEGPKNDKSSGVNLSKLGLGVGKIHSNSGPGAIHTNFNNSAGGAGGGSGSAAKTLGFGGGVGSGQSLGLAGAQGALNQFGSGAGGGGSGQGGSGGLGGAGLGTGFGKTGAGSGHGRANVVVPPGDPVVSGGLTSQEVQSVIRANLNQIRHCYEQLLQRSPSASGKVKVNFVVAANGRVSSANVANSSISDSMLLGCITSKVQRWSFPQPRGGSPVNVTYPFVFNPL